ncbi:MAG TPA: glycosyltransferase [Bacteriovoracaceae bacterium]|nr:glycosyltransferase [Bacteriovoracaceae bacterium]
MTKKLIILTSRQNFIWTSMEEIITWIEKTWSKWAQSNSIEYQVINVDEISFKDIAKACFHADKILVTCFNLKIANVLSGLRGKLGINAPWIFYLHGLASFGCWPLYRWKVGELLTLQDVFIGSCQRDLEQVRIVFPEIKTFIIPFSLPLPQTIAPKRKGNKKKFAFIGRISSQKNLHRLLLAAALLKDEFELHFFGKEDFYGSPLMGFKDHHYLQYLKEISQKFNLDDKVHFHGFMDRLEIEKMMEEEEWTFIVPSIHSDENFGMAAFRCLLNGHRCILSDWGGHADYPHHFPQQVKLLKVYQSSIGPWISINELKDAMQSSFENFEEYVTPAYYSDADIFKRIAEAYFYQGEFKKVITTDILQTILERRESFIESNASDGSRLYYDYQDSLKDSFFTAYAGGAFTKEETNNNQIVPWVQIMDQIIEISDPHRGKMQINKNDINIHATGLSYLTSS